MDILQYLTELLKTRKEIGVEGLGTFYKKKTPGRYDAETHSFLPPSYTLEFMPQVTEDKNLLAYIQTQRNISEDSAKYFINLFVTQIKEGTTDGTPYVLKDLGSFQLENGLLKFNPLQNINIGFDFFALPSVSIDLPKPQSTVKENATEASSTTDEHDVPAQEPIQDGSSATVAPEIEHVEVPEFKHEAIILPETSAEEEKSVEATTAEATGTETFEEISEANEIDANHLAAAAPQDEEHENTPTEEISAEVTETEPTGEAGEATDEVFEEISEANEVDHDQLTGMAPQDEESENTTATQEIAHDVEERQPTEQEDEVFEEISEVTADIPSQIHQEEDKENWDFDDEHVVAVDDIHEQQPITNQNRFEETFQKQTADLASDEPIKFTATTHHWDFDKTADKDTNSGANTLIGEFDEEVSEDHPSVVEKSPMPLYQKISIGLVVLLAIALVAYFVDPTLFENLKKNQVNPDEKIAVPIGNEHLKTQEDSLSFADSIMKNAEKAGIKVEPAKDTLQVITKKSEVKPTITYDVIVAAFIRQSEVDEFINHMKRKGFDAKVANMPGKRKKISIASYNNIDSAQKYVDKFRKQFNNPEIYVQPIKNN